MNDLAKWSVGFWMLACSALGCGDDAASGSGGGSAASGSATSAGQATATGSTGGQGGTGGGEADACQRGVLEDDLSGQNADGSPAPVVWLGPGADPETGELLPADGVFVASSTYLTLEASPEAQAKFGQLMQPILGDLFTNPDLVAIQLGTSASCATARTFAVWRSLEGMMRFVAGDAHAAAVMSVGEVSRGGSVVTHWEDATIDSLDWDEATARLAATEGPMY